MNNMTTRFADIIPMIEERLFLGETVTFSPSGESMLPLFRQGRDTVTLSPVKGRVRKNDIVFFRRDDGSFVLHRVVRVGETLEIIGDNQLYRETNIKYEQLIGVVTSFERRGRCYGEKKMKSRPYLAYISLRRILRRLINKIRRILKGRN